MIGTKFKKPLPIEDYPAYAKAADWCNNNGAYIQEVDDGYVVMEYKPEDYLPGYERYQAELRLAMNNVAAKFGYDDINVMCSYEDDLLSEKYSNEAKAAKLWRTQCWEYLFNLEGNPTIQEFIDGMPNFPLEIPSDYKIK